MINGYCDKQEQIIYGFMHLKAEEEKEEEQQQKFGVCRYVCRLTNVIFFYVWWHLHASWIIRPDYWLVCIYYVPRSCEDKTWQLHTRGHTAHADIISLRLALSSLLTAEVCWGYILAGRRCRRQADPLLAPATSREVRTYRQNFSSSFNNKKASNQGYLITKRYGKEILST